MHIMIHSSFVLVSFSSDGSTTTGTIPPGAIPPPAAGIMVPGTSV